MWLVLCERQDLPALWAYRGLVQRGLSPIHLVTSEVLSAALRWELRLTTQGTSSEVSLPDGTILPSDAVRGVLNRLTAPSFAQLAVAASEDRDYAMQEMWALLLSWLHSLPGVMLNRPSPQGLSGPQLRLVEWLRVAADAGLRTVPLRMSSDDLDPDARALNRFSGTDAQSLYVIAGRLLGPPWLPSSLLDGCRRIAEATSSNLLGIEVLHSPRGEWLFAGASPHPDLRRGGAAVLDALADGLSGSIVEVEGAHP